MESKRNASDGARNGVTTNPGGGLMGIVAVTGLVGSW
jgi:hypothetical protein